ncbi:MAG TPA: hypothetical protein VFZ49_07065, partial [Pyrinomonadaceae bacterium]
FSIEGEDPVKISDYLMAKHRIITAPIVHDDFKGVRITPNIFTRLQDLDRFVDAIESYLRNGGGR